MQNLLKRHFWLVGALTVVVCAFFAARITGSVVEAKYLTDAEKGPKLPVVAAAAAGGDKPATVARSKDGKALVDRNMFCSSCLPPVPEAPTAVAAGDPSYVPYTSLPLQLVATSVASRSEYSFASVLNTATMQQGGFFIGDELPGGGKVTAIRYKYVDFENPAAAKRVERISLLGEAPPPPPKPTTVAAADPTPADDGNKDELQAAIDSGLKKIDDTTFEIDRSLVDKVLVNPAAISKGARVVAAVKNGKPDGFKMYAIKPSSAFAKLGFSNGDTLHAINGFELTSMDKALEMYTKLREANQLQVEVTRRGKPVTLNYAIR